MTQKTYFIGIMSGTSLDGIDLALVEFSTDHKMNVIATDILPMPEFLQKKLLALHKGDTHLSALGELNQALARTYAHAVQQFLQKHPNYPITAIGCHGQTVWHAPEDALPFTMQLGDMQYLAVATGLPVVGDFRSKDIALGGQGAPLVPAFHQGIFFDENYHTAVLNLGGISNVSLLSASQPVVGFDTGPANALLDSWVAQHLGVPFDKNGEWAARGNVHQALLAHCLRDPYFQRPAPKSTGREYFNLFWLRRQLEQIPESISPVDVQATLNALTVQCNVLALNQWRANLPPLPARLIICGGGTHNRHLWQSFVANLPQWQVQKSDDFGIHSDFVEAAAFAWLAKQRWHNLPSNLLSVTGAKRATSLGVIFTP